MAFGSIAPLPRRLLSSKPDLRYNGYAAGEIQMAGELAEASTDVFSQMILSVGRVFDRSPAEFELLRTVTLEHLQSSDEPVAGDGFKHVAEHVSAIFPRVMSDPRLNNCKETPLAAYGSPETNPPGIHAHLAPVGVVVLGSIILIAVGAITIGYCLGGPVPEPGHSVPARCAAM